MNIDFLIKRDVLIIYLSGELDEYNAASAKHRIDTALDKYSYKSAVFDLSNLAFMDSTGVGMFIGRYKKLSRQNKKVFIQNPCFQVEKILRMSGLYQIMPKIKNEVI
ncbi:MAG: anti-sigma factor antagonist [Clostridia bacterium]|nr:anti-sigma factor antagonist [Clostridia bacterium]